MKFRSLTPGLILAGLAILSPAVQAAPPISASAPHTAGTDLHLSPAQQKQIQTLVTQFQKELGALKNDKTMTPPQKQAKFQGMMKTLDQKKLAVLTPSQRAQVLQQRKAMMAKMKSQQGKYQARMSQMLALKKQLTSTMTADQKKKIQQISNDAETQQRQIAQDPKLTDAVKRERMMAVSHDLRPKVHAILTPAQRVIIDKMEALGKKPL